MSINAQPDVIQRVQFLKETTPGTAVGATRRMKSFEYLRVVPNPEFAEHRPAGSKRTELVYLNKEMTTLRGQGGKPFYTEIGRLLACSIAKPVTVAGPVANTYDHYYTSEDFDADDIQTLTIECGHPDGSAKRVTHAMIPELGFSTNRDALELEATFIGHDLEVAGDDDNYTALTAGANEVQTYTLPAGTDGGTFDLYFKGAKYTAAWDVSTSALQTALRALATIGAGNINVTGTAGVSYVLTFAGDLAGKNHEMFVIDESALTDGGLAPGAPGAIIETTRGGLAEDELVPIKPNHITVYLSDDLDDLGEESVDIEPISTNWRHPERFKPYWVQKRAETSFHGVVEGAQGDSITILAEVSQDWIQRIQDYRDNTRLFVRIEAISTQMITGTTPYMLRLDSSVMITGIEELGENQGLYTVAVTFKMTRDADLGWSYRYILRNGISAY